MDKVLALVPEAYRQGLKSFAERSVEEIRLRLNRQPTVNLCGREIEIPKTPPVTEDCIHRVLAAACGGSLYSAADMIRNGYVTVRGGHRIGISGRMICTGGELRAIEPVSLNIRIARDLPGVGTKLYKSTLIAGPPGCGKTSLLRGCIRILSDKQRNRVSVADERGEISGNGFFWLGNHTDVMFDGAKAEAMERLLRTMTPDWLVTDEITREEDADLLIRGAYCGAKLLATCHLQSCEELFKRPVYKRLMESAVFSEVIVMKRDHTWQCVGTEAIG